jgi:hypothetical protein
MKHPDSGVEDLEQWRARITRALQELQSQDGVSAGRLRDESREDNDVDSIGSR